MNDKVRAWEGLGFSGMFGGRLLRDDFLSKLELISFLSKVMSVSKSFVFPALLKKIGAECSLNILAALELLVSKMSWRSFRKLRSINRHFLQTLTTTMSSF